MLYLIFIVFFVSNMDGILCENKGTHTRKWLNITLSNLCDSCCISENHLFQDGDIIKLNIRNKLYHNHALRYISYVLYSMNNHSQKTHFAEIKNGTAITFNKTLAGEWRFKILYLGNISSFSCQNESYMYKYKETTYATSVCTTEVSLGPPEDSKKAIIVLNVTWTIITITILVIITIVIIGQSAAIVYYRSKVQKLSMHNCLIKQTDEIEPDDRYSTNPTKKIEQTVNHTDDGDIYEVPDITLGGLSLPPALPNTPRPERNALPPMRIPPSPSKSTLRSNAVLNQTFPRPKPTDQDSLARRPPIPIPQDVYSEADEEETYEPPPTNEAPPQTRTLPHKINKLPDLPKPGIQPKGFPLPKPQKPPISQSKPTPPRNNVQSPVQQLPNPSTLRPVTKPAIQLPVHQIPGPSSLKPTPKPVPALPSVIEARPPRQRNNVVQLPVHPIPDPSSSRPNPKPPVNKQNTSTLSTREQQAQFFNDHRHNCKSDSSDEEWTYEPLPQYNIYNM